MFVFDSKLTQITSSASKVPVTSLSSVLSLTCRFEFLGDTTSEAELPGLVDRQSAQSILQGVLRDTLDTALALVQGPGIVFVASLSQVSFNESSSPIAISNQESVLRDPVLHNICPSCLNRCSSVSNEEKCECNF